MSSTESVRAWRQANPEKDRQHNIESKRRQRARRGLVRDVARLQEDATDTPQTGEER